MIFDDLVVATKAMQDLQKKIAVKNNKAIQDNTDTKYRLLLTQVNHFVEVIEYLYTDLSVSLSDEILTSISGLLNVLEQIATSGMASQEGVANADDTFRVLQNSIKKEWSKLYTDLTGATVSTLSAIRGIEPDHVGSCLQKIQLAENWDLDVKKYQTMHTGLHKAGQLIVGLGLDDEIITFLQNTNTGRATLQDLNDKVFAWIRAEQLERKIRISFVKAK